jgi:hypothetical protein
VTAETLSFGIPEKILKAIIEGRVGEVTDTAGGSE